MGFSASAAFLLAGWGGLSVALALLVVGAVAAVAGVLLRRRWQGRAAAIVGVTIVVAMGAFWRVEKRTFQPLEAYAGKTLSLTMEITDHPTDYARSARYTARVTQGDLPTGTRLTLWITSADVRPQPYDRLSGQVALFPLEEDAAQRRQDKAEGIVLSGSLRIGESVTVQTPTQKPWGAALLSVRQAAAGLVERYLSGEPAALVKSLCLGDRSVVSGAIKDDFRTCGVSHLLVVSGLHLSMIAGAVQALLRLLRCRRRPAAVITMLVVIAFMLLVGFTPSVKRAGVMLLVLLAGELFRREADGLNSLGLALLLIGLLDPYMVWDIGLQLSAGSTAGILLLYPRMQRGWLLSVQQSSHAWVRALYRPAQMVAVSLSAMLVLPLLILYFGEISLVFLPANLLMVYPATGAVVVGLLGLVCGGWCAPAGTLLFGTAGLLARLLDSRVARSSAAGHCTSAPAVCVVRTAAGSGGAGTVLEAPFSKSARIRGGGCGDHFDGGRADLSGADAPGYHLRIFGNRRRHRRADAMDRRQRVGIDRGRGCHHAAGVRRFVQAAHPAVVGGSAAEFER